MGDRGHLKKVIQAIDPLFPSQVTIKEHPVLAEVGLVEVFHQHHLAVTHLLHLLVILLLHLEVATHQLLPEAVILRLHQEEVSLQLPLDQGLLMACILLPILDQDLARVARRDHRRLQEHRVSQVEDNALALEVRGRLLVDIQVMITTVN